MSNDVTYTLILGTALDEIKKLKTSSVDCVITSPPYWQLRDYGFKEQWGQEKTPEEYLNNLWLLMDEIKRVLKPTGTVWINIADTYGTVSGSMGTKKNRQYILSKNASKSMDFKQSKPKGKSKSLLLLPHRFAIGCNERGWIIRNDIIWAKPNAMPESVKDRFSKKHEYMFFMTKQKEYYFNMDAIRDKHKETSIQRSKNSWNGHKEKYTSSENFNMQKALHPKGKNPGDVTDFWDISTNPGSKSKHYAKFNRQLVSKPIIAGCKKGGIVLDPFCGTSTTGVETLLLSRNFIGIDGKAAYIKESEKKLKAALKGQLGNVNDKQQQFVSQIQQDLANHVKHNKLSVEKLALSFGISDKTLVKELTELAIVITSRELAHRQGTMNERFDAIVAIYNSQVNLSHRTSQSMLLQQYSTPAPIGYLASAFVISNNGKIYFEPSAGNGLLTIAGTPNQFYVNEIDEVRNNNLKTQHFVEVTKQDATQPFPYTKKFDGVVTNPPFGALDKVIDFDDFPISVLDHLMCIRALDTMKDNGRAALIIGGHTSWDKEGRIQAGKNRIFFAYLYKHYHVFDVINIDGHKLYSRQGTAFNVRLILIGGRKSVQEGFPPLFDSKHDKVVYSFEDLFDRVTKFISTENETEELESEALTLELELMKI